jgi:hypothetical protein
MARAAAKAVSLEESVFMCVSQVVVIVDGGILSAIVQALTRYSANDPQFSVNDRSLFTGKSHAIGGASRPNGRPMEKGRGEAGAPSDGPALARQDKSRQGRSS